MDSVILGLAIGAWCYGWLLGALTTMYDDYIRSENREFSLLTHIIGNFVTWPLVILALLRR